MTKMRVTWTRTGPGLWLVTSRPETHQAVGGVTFSAGSLHQLAEHLGVVNLLAADTQVPEALALAQRRLLLAVPPEEAAAEPPFPMAERVKYRDVARQGRGFASLVDKGWAARVSAERVDRLSCRGR